MNQLKTLGLINILFSLSNLDPPLKKNYLLARANGEKNAIGDFLSSIGYNVSSSTMKGRTDEYEVSRDKNLIENDDDHDSSNWIVQNENSVLEELDNQDVQGVW